MTTLHLDLEVFSETDLTAIGVYKYADHASTEILCAGYAFDHGTVFLWVPFDMPAEMKAELLSRMPSDAELINQAEMPVELRRHLDARKHVRAHNLQYERVVTAGVAGQRLRFPRIKIEGNVCTAAKARANGLPGKLEDGAEALGTYPKSKLGSIEMKQITKPRKPTKADPSTRWTYQNAPEKFIAMFLYNIDDIKAERNLDEHVPDLTPYEQKVYEMDQRINDRGWLADREAVGNIMAVVDEYKEYLTEECDKATGDALLDLPGLKPTQRDKIAEWVRANGYPQLMDMQADTVKSIVADSNVPDKVKHVLKIYSTFNAKAVSKFDTILEMACADGRLRGMFMYHGANTGRWSSRGVQLQNLSRGSIDNPDEAISAFASRSLAWIKALYPDVDPIKVAASCVRGVLISAAGFDLMFPDYAGIESRGVAWLFDEQWKLEVFRKYDTILRDEHTGAILLDKKGEPLRAGPDNYKSAYAEMFQVSMETVTKFMRQVGKVVELFMAYEGGCGAFVTGAETYGIDLEELAQIALPMIPEEIKTQAQKMWDEMPQHRAGLPWNQFIAFDSLKRMWRNKHPRIKQGWRDMKAAAEQAVQFPGKAFSIPNGKIAFKVLEYKGRSWLNMRLPSGRTLKYYKPRWIPEESVLRKDEFGNEYTEIIPGEMRYMGVDTNTRRWMETHTYGGKLTENAVQGLSACLLRAGMFALEEAGYQLIGSVHDEAVLELPEGFGSLDEASKLMCRELAWTKGLPLATEGHRAKRYRK